MKRTVLAFVFLVTLLVPVLAFAQIEPPDVSGSWWYQVLEWAKGFLAGQAWPVAKLAGVIVIITAVVKVLAVLVKIPGLANGWAAFGLSAAIGLLTYVAEIAADSVVTGAEAATFLQVVGGWITAALVYRGTLSRSAQAGMGK